MLSIDSSVTATVLLLGRYDQQSQSTNQQVLQHAKWRYQNRGNQSDEQVQVPKQAASIM